MCRQACFDTAKSIQRSLLSNILSRGRKIETPGCDTIEAVEAEYIAFVYSQVQRSCEEGLSWKSISLTSKVLGESKT